VERYRSGSVVAEKYRLEETIAEGGMGSVWLARNVMLDAPVALKFIHPRMQHERAIARFELEARVEARFNHPNIVRVFDLGYTEFGDPFIVMEVLDGVTLGDLIRERGRLGAVEAVQIALPIIAALSHVHGEGVVHRDLKPDNILLSRGSAGTTPKLLDFGIAKLVDQEPDSRVTQARELIGSPAYMAPEQIQGTQDIDHRADVWAICVVLYEAISGKRAFPGEGFGALCSVLEATVEPLEDTGAGERDLHGVLSRGLEKDRALRFASILELGNALAQWLYDRGVREDVSGASLSHSWQVVTSATDSAPAETPAPNPPAAELY
jgi:serine/threonine-protein kinase